MTQDDQYIAKCMTTGVPIARIARKLSMTEDQVFSRWKAMLDEARTREENGYNATCDYFTILSNQYQLLGESLKNIGAILGNIATDEDLKKLIAATPEETLLRLKTRAIVLRPVIIQTPPPEPPPLSDIGTPERN